MLPVAKEDIQIIFKYRVSVYCEIASILKKKKRQKKLTLQLLESPFHWAYVSWDFSPSYSNIIFKCPSWNLGKHDLRDPRYLLDCRKNWKKLQKFYSGIEHKSLF